MKSQQWHTQRIHAQKCIYNLQSRFRIGPFQKSENSPPVVAITSALSTGLIPSELDTHFAERRGGLSPNVELARGYACPPSSPSKRCSPLKFADAFFGARPVCSADLCKFYYRRPYALCLQRIVHVAVALVHRQRNFVFVLQPINGI